MPADITLQDPAATCALILHANTNFGHTRDPGTRITLHPDNINGTGFFSFSGSHTRTFTVQVTFPSALQSSGTALPYSGAWAQSQTPHHGFFPVTGPTYQRTALPRDAFTHYFRVGGTVDIPSDHVPPGIYRARMAITGSCH